MGTYASLLFFISFFKFLRVPSFFRFSVSILFFTCVLLTYSRSAIVCLAIGLLFHFTVSFQQKSVLRFYLFFAAFAFSCATLMGFDKLVNFTGGLGKFISYIELVNEGTLRYQRFEIWADGLNSMLNNPFAILVGFGHGEVLLEYVTGIAFYESLFLQVFMEGGVVGLLLIGFHFYAVILTIAMVRKRQVGRVDPFIDGLFFFMPGFIAANLVGGNLWQTDFFAPLFYCSIAISVASVVQDKNVVRHSCF